MGVLSEFLSHPTMTQPPVSIEGFSDSDEVFPKEMTKWNSNDFIDAFASPSEVEGVPDPAIMATKGIEDGARAPRDSEASMFNFSCPCSAHLLAGH